MREEMKVEKEETIGRVPTCILGSEVKKLCNKEVKLVKVQWGEDREDAIWEAEDKIRASYLFLFENMFLTSFSKLRINTCIYRLNISYRLSR